MKPKSTKENQSQKLNRSKRIISNLEKTYPDAHCELVHKNPFELLIATMLSAQCTDARVNKVTPELFSAYPNAGAMANAQSQELEEIIRSTGFFRNKAKNILACSQKLVSQYDGKVPETMEDLSSLPGVGRKTANVVLGNAFGVPGLVVDTHVTRLSNRLGLARGEDAVKLERELEKVVPKNKWTLFSHLMIFHGRRTCKARRPDCEACTVFKLCPRKGVKH
ncbi:MAG: endonuclease III [Oligoflexia bacterium]|nr:endonuclease III [Oligoflexia bacterium]